jgi:hypothetical protein
MEKMRSLRIDRIAARICLIELELHSPLTVEASKSECAES